MRFFRLLILAILTTNCALAKSQVRTGSSFRMQTRTKGNYRVTVIDMPKNVSGDFQRLKPRFLFYRPVSTNAIKLPMIVTLHGSGGGRRSIEQKKWQGTINQLLRPENKKFEAFVLEPQSVGEWEPDSLEKMIEYVIENNPEVDTNRIYCMGYSMGGKGTWEWSMNYPNRFAAIIPKGFIPDLSRIQGMVNLPIWAMVGDQDSKPRVEGIPAMEKALREKGSTKIKVTIFKGANHASAAGRSRDEPGIFDWLFSWELE